MAFYGYRLVRRAHHQLRLPASSVFLDDDPGVENPALTRTGDATARTGAGGRGIAESRSGHLTTGGRLETFKRVLEACGRGMRAD